MSSGIVTSTRVCRRFGKAATHGDRREHASGGDGRKGKHFQAKRRGDRTISQISQDRSYLPYP